MFYKVKQTNKIKQRAYVPMKQSVYVCVCELTYFLLDTPSNVLHSI